MDQVILQQNLEALDRATDEIEGADDNTFRRFYHLLILQCAKRMSVEDFNAALKSANRRPV